MISQIDGTNITGVYNNSNVGYTVVGSPTISDGVVSGFSTNDYLSINGQTITDFEVCVPFTTGTNVLSQQVIWGQQTTSGVQILANGSMKFSVNDSHGTGREVILTYKLASNTKYRFIASKKDDYTISLTLYDTSGNVLDTATATSTVNNVNITSIIGKNAGTSYYFKGSVDINNTYIKVDGITWFNGKETASSTVNEVYYNKNCGYTVVGSPTISDGVASGFSANNYLRTSENFLKTYTDFEIVCRAKPAPAGSGLLCQGNGFGGNWTFILSPSTVIMVPGTYANRLQISNLGLDTTKFYYIRYLLKNSIATISLSEDGVVYNQIGSMTMDLSSLTSNTYLVFGHNTNYGSSFNGSIDLNHTYIKVNSITWFNGKQAASGAIWTRGA